MRIRKIREIKYITIKSATSANKEYVGKSFEAIINQNKDIVGFKDWLNGNNSNGYTKDIEDFAFDTGSGIDIELFDNSIASTNVDVVRNRLIQKLSIQYGELQYNFIETFNIGIPYLNKKSKAEMDLILKNEILKTEGVKQILEFNSTVVDRHYKLEFKVLIDKGEIVWLTIDQ